MKKMCFNRNWEYWKYGEEENVKQINLPHDAMIHEKRDPECENRYNTGYYPGGKYVYRKKFTFPSEYLNKKIVIEFEGVYRDCEIFLNDNKIGSNNYGYSNFYIDLTNIILFDKENILEVIVDNSQTPNSRWYSGSGIYRDVKLFVGNRNHIDINGVKLTTLSVKDDVATIHADVTLNIEDEEDYCVTTKFYFDEKLVLSVKGVDIEFEVKNARLWSAQEPNLYSFETILELDGQEVDKHIGRFGIRTLEVLPAKGLFINGEKTILLGGCVHHDSGVLGSATLKDFEYRRVKIMKENGFNAIRASHNPISKHLLDACDELGMYVMDEAFDMWFSYKTKYDYAKNFRQDWEKDLAAMVHKDYNHPSVIMYSIGNEIYDSASPRAAVMAERMVEKIKSIDKSRYVIDCLNILSALHAKTTDAPPEEFVEEVERAPGANLLLETRAGNDWLLNVWDNQVDLVTSGELDEKLGELLSKIDIIGYNYSTEVYELTKDSHPNRINCGSENFPEEIVENYRVATNEGLVIGDFVWTGWDYIGEASIGTFTYGDKDEGLYKEFPALLAGCGLIDITGYPTQQAYYRQIVCEQMTGPYIAVRPLYLDVDNFLPTPWRQFDGISSWTWDGYEGQNAQVEVFSSGHMVELFVNGESVGKERVEKYFAKFNTPYVKGKITAIQYDVHGKETGRMELVTASEEAKLSVEIENSNVRANGHDLIFVNLTLTDQDNNVKIMDDLKIKVEVEGEAAKFAGLGSGNPSSEDEFASGECHLYHGRALLILRAGYEAGEVKVRLSAGDFEEVLTINVINP